MALDNSIHNRVAGFIWLGTGVVGTYWVNALAKKVRDEVGGWRQYFFGPEPGDVARARFRSVQVRLWGFVAAWLGMYVILDWLF